MIEKRRINRVSSNFRVSINLCNTDNDNAPIGSPVAGRIVNFTPYGACLYLDNIQCGSHHIFYTTQDHENHIVSLEYTTNDEDDFLVIYGNPVWYDLFSSETDSAKYKIGIEFMVEQDKETLQKFLAKLAGQQDAEEGWLRKLFK
jgi:hypothetical protein